MTKYSLSNSQKQLFIAIIILDELVDKHKAFTTQDAVLQPVLQRMVTKELLTLTGVDYAATPKGEQLLQSFYKRYDEYIKVYDIYCAVDLEKGVFAYEKFWDFDTQEEFLSYINDEPTGRWSDVRVAVCEYKKLDPMEIVFLAFLNEGRINTNDEQWRTTLMSGAVWKEIELVCNNAIHVEDLQDGDAITNLVKQGSELMMKLLEIEKQKKADEAASNVTETTTTVTETTETTDVMDDVSYYGLYLNDPYYTSLCWRDYYYDDPYWW